MLALLISIFSCVYFPGVLENLSFDPLAEMQTVPCFGFVHRKIGKLKIGLEYSSRVATPCTHSFHACYTYILT